MQNQPTQMIRGFREQILKERLVKQKLGQDMIIFYKYTFLINTMKRRACQN